jgi:hypothetical protein
MGATPMPQLLLAGVMAMLLYATVASAQSLDLKALERDRVLPAAAKFLGEKPVTITAFPNPRSAGGVHDFSSEGDYWWPDPKNPGGPYVQRDGETNPDNFVAHRHAMVRMSIHVATLTAAYRITHDRRYADKAIEHLRAWFIDPQTRMNPNLQYAQAIHGRTTGRGIGIIDTVHLIEPARAAQVLAEDGALKGEDLAGVKKWFADYLTWMTTSENGLDEMKAQNNHGTCWVEQVAAFASFTGDREKLDLCRKRFKEVLLPEQMAADGSFPRELKRTKPYGYSLFNADAMATVAWICSHPQEGTRSNDLWTFTTRDGKNLRRAVEFIEPYIADKSSWPYRHDVMFYDQWPVRSPVLLFGGLAYHEPAWLDVWMRLEANPTNEEVLRNLPIRQPLLWVELPK